MWRLMNINTYECSMQMEVVIQWYTRSNNITLCDYTMQLCLLEVLDDQLQLLRAEHEVLRSCRIHYVP